MGGISRQAGLTALAAGLASSGILGASFILANLYSVAPHGSEAVLWLALLIVLPLLAAILIIPLAAFLTIFRRTRRIALLTLIFSVVFAVTVIGCIGVGKRVRMRGFHKLSERSAPLVAAIREYETDHGQPPSTLGDLVPQYLAMVPGTGMGAYPEYEYLSGEDAEEYEGNPWILRIETPSGGINWDQFLYFPNGNYPQNAYSAWCERVGDWAYYHE